MSWFWPPGISQKLQELSAATINRILSGRKKRMRLKARSVTKPGTLLKQKIPVRTFADWDDARSGFMEMDMVAHEGGNPSGEYALTLNLTDVSSGWTKLRAVKNKAQKWVFEALGLIRSRLPFPLLGLDSDNDSAFTTIICTIIARTKTSPSPGRGSQGKTTTASWSRRTGPSPEEPSGMQGMIRKKGAYHE